MTEVLEAIYKNGIFSPLEHSALADGSRVRITVELPPISNPTDLLELAGTVYDSLTAEQIAAIEKEAMRCYDFFREAKE